MASDARIPGIQLKSGEKLEMVVRPHPVIYFRFVHIFIIPLILTILRAKSYMMVITNKRVIIQAGLISKEQTKIDLLKVQDVSCGVSGLLRRVLSAGWIQLETAGRSSGILFAPVANYQACADRISELMDEAKKNEQMAMAESIAHGIKSAA